MGIEGRDIALRCPRLALPGPQSGAEGIGKEVVNYARVSIPGERR